jgi:hypothetical protein
MNIHDLILNVQGLLGRTLKDARTPEEQELFRVAASALMFISETGAVHPFEDYLSSRRGAPPYAVASFATREEADAWLLQHPEPPHGAFVLIADAYSIVMCVREANDRRLFPHPILEGYLEQLQRDAPPAFTVSFVSREEAEAWLKAQPEPPQRVDMLIAGRGHVALYHRNLRRHAIHPLPPVTGGA